MGASVGLAGAAVAAGAVADGAGVAAGAVAAAGFGASVGFAGAAVAAGAAVGAAWPPQAASANTPAMSTATVAFRFILMLSFVSLKSPPEAEYRHSTEAVLYTSRLAIPMIPVRGDQEAEAPRASQSPGVFGLLDRMAAWTISLRPFDPNDWRQMLRCP